MRGTLRSTPWLTLAALLVPLPLPRAGAVVEDGAAVAPAATAPEGTAFSLQNAHARIVAGADGRSFQLIDLKTGADIRARSPGASAPASWAHVRIGGVEHGASAAVAEEGAPDGSGGAGALKAPGAPGQPGSTEEKVKSRDFRVAFGASGAMARLRLTARSDHFVLEVLYLEGAGVESFTFIDLDLKLKALPDEPLACCAIALNLRANVWEIPGPSAVLRAVSYSKLGFAGASVALVACPPEAMRDVLKRAVEAAPDLPHSRLGGPWALDAEAARGSYLFNFGGLSEATVDDWIAATRKIGFTQIDFHGGSSFRFGDCRPNPETYPKGFESLKGVIDRLHAAGIAAGLHTYAFFIDKTCPWVSPVPDSRLGRDASFTLAEPLVPDAATVLVREPTKGMSATTGFFVRNSATLMVEEELIAYGGVQTAGPPYAFTGCQRGALGTKAAVHPAGAKVHHLKECFGLLTPDGDSTLLEEVAARTAEAYNRCGFDMIYMDALDGEDILGGPEWGWHYGSKFVYEVARRLERPAVMEMSTFHHHLWCVRSRMGAWDHPTRSHKRFIDIHCAANEDLRRRFLPGQLGWWAVKTWSGHQGEPTFADDIEYLCAKALGNGTGLSLMGIDPRTIVEVAAYERLAKIFRDYEGLRHKGYFDEKVKARLREPGKEYTLIDEGGGKWSLRPVQYARHRVEGLDGWSDSWTVESPFADQPIGLRIEALHSAGSYEAEGNLLVDDLERPETFGGHASPEGVEVSLSAVKDPVKVGSSSGAFSASSRRGDRRGSWAKVAREFSPPLDLSQRQALGVWVHGDGKGEVLNLQLTCPEHIVAAIGEHYVVIDFEGWRYFELIEPEGERFERYAWPYGNPYAIYRESVDYGHVRSLGLWYNDLPPGDKVTCYLSPIRALPLVSVKVEKPSITVEGRTLTFPADVETGSYLEFRPPSECRLYGPTGALLYELKPEGEVPVLRRGSNRVQFRCAAPTHVRPRARVTLISVGEAM